MYITIVIHNLNTESAQVWIREEKLLFFEKRY